MIRIFKLLFLLVISQVAFAQAPSNYTNINGRYRWIAGMFDSTFHIPKGTNPSLRTGGSTNAGALFYKTGDSSLYIYTGTQWLKQAGTAGFVPYSGATDTLDMGQFGLKTKFVQFDTSSRAVTDRVLQWSNDNGTLAFGMTNGSTITQNVGLQQFARVKNVQGSQINKGQVVYLYGASGDRAAVKLADNRADSTSSKTLGIAIENIPINGEGFVGTFGTMSGLNLSAYTPGDQLYLDSIPGGLTKTKPQAPYHMVFIGVVERANAGNGLLFTNVQNGYELEELHNVKITSPVNNKAVLIYDSINRLWVDTTVAGAGLAVTSVATNTGTGITGGTITTSGTLAIDTLLISTRAWRQKGIDSLQANINLKVNISDTSSMLSPYLRKADTTAMLQNYVNNVGFGLDKASQVVSVDTLEMSTRAWRQKGIDSVAALVTSGYVPNSRTITINGTTQDLSANRTYNVGTVTSVATNTGTGITGGTFTTSGTIAADTLLLSTRAWRQKGIDSVAALVGGAVAGTTNYIPKFTSSSAIGNSVIYESSSNIGIGTTSPSSILHLYKASEPEVYYQSSAATWRTGLNSDNDFYVYTANAKNFYISTNGSERMRLDASGRLGLGVTPSAWGSGFRAFDFNTLGTLAASGSAVLLQNNSYNNGTNNIRKAIGEASSYSQNGGAHIWETAAFGSSGSTITFSESMRIAASGNVGIGVSNPDSYNASAYKLVVGGLANSGITIAGDASEGSSNLYFADGTTGDQAYRGFLSYTHSNDYLTIGTSGTTRMTITSGGNVGIATSAPDGKLDVNGTSYFRDDLILYGTKKLYLDSGSDTYLTEVSANTMQFVTGGSERMRITSAGNVGIGVTPSAWSAGKAFEMTSVGNGVWASPDIYLFRNSYYNSGWKYAANGAAGNYYIGSSGEHVWSQAASGTAGNAISFTQAMTLDASGNLGIGTTAPGVRLHAEASNSNVAIINVIGTAPNYIFDVRDDGVSKFRVDPSGNVGIGTTSPGAPLDVVGSARISGDYIATTSGNTGRFGYNAYYTSTGFNLVSEGAINLTFGTNSAERMRITSGGEVYIAGTTDQGAYNLQVNGTGVWGAGAYVNGSDSSLKENIQNMGSALELVNQLQPKTYTYKPSYSKDTTIQVGFIAQDLEQVLGTQIYKNSIVVDGPNFKSVAYQNLIPLLVQSIKELKAEIETLKNK